MVVRPIKPEERIQFSKIVSIAYLINQDFTEYENNPEKFQEGYERVRAAFDDSGKMCAGMALNPYQIRFDGNTVPMAGVGGVATLPEYRRRGYIREIFKYCLAEMYDKDYVFSYLYPFSYEYYRKFGYELNMINTQYTIPFSSLAHFKQSGAVQMFAPGSDAADIISVYNEFTEDKNLSVVREDTHWKRFLEKDPYKMNVFLYVWYDSNGRPKGYFQCSIDRNVDRGQSPNMRVNECLWSSGEAFAGMMAFLYGFSSQLQSLMIRVPLFMDIISFFPEPSNIEGRIQFQGMNRVVNVQKSLELMRVPSGSGSLVIAVNDNYIKANTDRYKIEWEDGESRVRRSKDEPDLICEINDFSQLITGFSSVSSLLNAGRIEVKGDIRKLNSFFTKTDLFLNDFF